MDAARRNTEAAIKRGGGRGGGKDTWQLLDQVVGGQSAIKRPPGFCLTGPLDQSIGSNTKSRSTSSTSTSTTSPGRWQPSASGRFLSMSLTDGRSNASFYVAGRRRSSVDC